MPCLSGLQVTVNGSGGESKTRLGKYTEYTETKEFTAPDVLFTGLESLQDNDENGLVLLNYLVYTCFFVDLETIGVPNDFLADYFKGENEVIQSIIETRKASAQITSVGNAVTPASAQITPVENAVSPHGS